MGWNLSSMQGRISTMSLLRDAADWLQTHEWSDDAIYINNKAGDTIGASVLGALSICAESNHSARTYSRTVRYLTRLTGDLTQFNDREGQTKNAVIMKLLFAADVIAHHEGLI